MGETRPRCTRTVPASGPGVAAAGLEGEGARMGTPLRGLEEES